MPASTEKKRNSGVRNVETTGLTPMATPSGMATSKRQHRADQRRATGSRRYGQKRAVLTPSIPACTPRSEGRKQPRIDVEIGNQNGPEREQHGERREAANKRRRMRPTKPHCNPYTFPPVRARLLLLAAAQSKSAAAAMLL